MKLGRNDPCHCGSGKKYKKCHGPLDQQGESRVEAVKIGTSWVKLQLDFIYKTVGETLGDFPLMRDQQLYDCGDESKVLAVSYLGADLVKKSQFDLFKASLSDTYLEPLEVTEVCRLNGEAKRNNYVKLRGVCSKVNYHIADQELAEELEPMEWVLGRVVVFEKRSFILGWTRVPFRKRKALRSALQTKLESGALPDQSWLKKESLQVVKLFEEVCR